MKYLIGLEKKTSNPFSMSGKKIKVKKVIKSNNQIFKIILQNFDRFQNPRAVVLMYQDTFTKKSLTNQ